MSVHFRVVQKNEEDPLSAREVCAYCTGLVGDGCYVIWPCDSQKEIVATHNKIFDFLKREAQTEYELAGMSRTGEMVAMHTGRREAYLRAQQYLQHLEEMS